MESSMLLYDTEYLQLKSTKSKSGADWYYAHRPNASGVVIILPVINGEKVLFLIEERPPISAENIGKYSIAIPAGLVGDERLGESTQDAIKAELMEETGLEPYKIKIMAKNVASSPGCVTETCTIAFAYIKEYTIKYEPVDDGGIIVERILVNISDIDEWLEMMSEKGYILSAQTLAALYYLKREV